MSPATTMRVRPLGVVVGLVTAAVAIGVGQLAAGIVDPHASPVVVVGQAAIDLSPEWLTSLAIRAFGSNDKAVLLAGIVVALFALAAWLGAASIRRPSVGLAGLGALTAIGVLAALTRPAARAVDAVPAIVAGLAGTGTLGLLLGTTGPVDRARDEAAAGAGVPVDRRRLLVASAAAVAGAIVAGGAGAMLGRRMRADASRQAVAIPAPADPADPVGAVDLDVPGLGPFFTPNDRFYRVDTTLLVPSLMAEDWELRVHGMVENELRISYDQLLARPLVERDITLTCVSNPVGGDYAGNARWIGAPLRDLLEEASPLAGADQIVSRSVDGFTIGTPTRLVMDGRDAMLAVGMNGEPLPLAHGFPVRMLVPGLYGYVSATKWLVELELSTFDAYDAYWVRRGWSERAPVETMSRIDTPSASASLTPGELPVAGVAWAPHVGIEAVQVSIDGGAWQSAELAGEDTVDTWRQWVYRWAATSGEHRLRVRAIDRSGVAQTAVRSDPYPDGATGHHEIVVRVS